jgi:hypothetical protein
MSAVRTILVLAIAASLALLPVAAYAAAMSMVQDDTQSTSMQMNASTDMSMDDCCPDHMNGAPSNTDAYKCPMGLCCAGSFVALADLGTVGFDVVSPRGNRIALPADQVISFRGGSAPFRPPRV